MQHLHQTIINVRKLLCRMVAGYERNLINLGVAFARIDYGDLVDQIKVLAPLINTGWFKKIWISSWASPFQIEGYLQNGDYFYFRSRNGKHSLQVAVSRHHRELLASFSFHTVVHRRGEYAEELSFASATSFIKANLGAYLGEI